MELKLALAVLWAFAIKRLKEAKPSKGTKETLFLQVRGRRPLRYLRLLGLPDRQHLVPDGRVVRLPPHAPLALGRVPVQVLQGRGLPLRALLIQGHPEAS